MTVAMMGVRIKNRSWWSLQIKKVAITVMREHMPEAINRKKLLVVSTN